MATASDIGKLTKLPEPPRPLTQKWQQKPTRAKSRENSPSRSKTPVIARNPRSNKTPKADNRSKTPIHTEKTSKTPKSAGKPKTPSGGGRFIPSRGMNNDYASYMILKGATTTTEPTQEDGDSEDEEDQEGYRGQGDPSFVKADNSEFHSTLMTVACGGEIPRGVLTYRNVTPSNQTRNGSFLNYTGNTSISSCCKGSLKKKERRKVSSEAEKILDAPMLTNDYYLNTLHWGRNNVLSVALGGSVYLWNPTTGTTSQLVQLASDDLYVSSVSWADTGKYLAVGISNGDIQLWDVNKEKKVRTMRGHEDRVSSLHWNSYTLSSGSRTGDVHVHDVRKPQHCIADLRHHSMEVCGLQWSPDGRYLASGGNDNEVCIWNPSAGDEVSMVLSGHTAAVKALAWCPWQRNLLATGGGSMDKTVRFWNVTTGECQQTLNAKSQVSGIQWSEEGKEFISSHGGPRNQLTIWNYPSLTKVAELKGHDDRILSLSISPKRTRVISAGADETLRIWKCFEPSKAYAAALADKENSSISTAFLGGMY